MLFQGRSAYRHPHPSFGHGPTRRRRVPLLLLGVATALLLSACQLFAPPRLEVRSDDLSGVTAEQATFTIRNGGGDRLGWWATTSDSRLSIRPAEGVLRGGVSQEVTIELSARAVVDGLSFATIINIDSSSGPFSLPFRYIGMGTAAQCRQLTSSAVRAAAPPSAEAVGDELLVGYRQTSGLSLQAQATQLRNSRVELLRRHNLQPLRLGAAGAPDLLRAPSGVEPEEFLALIAADPLVSYAQRNYYLEPQFSPNDTLYRHQWNLSSFGLEQAWDVQRGEGNEVIVAVIDSGVQTDHPDLAEKLLPGFDFYSRDNDPNPGRFPPNHANFGHAAHGTHVAGIVAASGNDGRGVSGVAFGTAVKILPLKVFADNGRDATISHLIDAIYWAAGLPVTGLPPNPNKAQVINMSLGVAGLHPAIDAAVEVAYNEGVLLVAAAGNHTTDPDPGVLSPGNSPCAIAVGSVDEDRTLSSFSNTGPQVELVAPGGFASGDSITECTTFTVLSTLPNSSYGCMAGTSMASPFVAGVAALLLSQEPALTPDQLRMRLSASTLLSSADADPAQYGNGLLCADRAIGAATRCGD